MRDSIRQSLNGAPDSEIDKTADEIAAAFKAKTAKSGVNFRNARPYWVSGWRGQKIYFCDSHDGISKLALNIEEITPELAGFKVVPDLPGRGSWAIADKVRARLLSRE